MTPESLYERRAVLGKLLGRLDEVAITLGDHVKRASSDAAKDGMLLDVADDGVPVGRYVHEARRLLADVAAKLEEATVTADQAHSALTPVREVE